MILPSSNEDSLRSEAPQPFQYQGSKRALARGIVERVPSGTSLLIEPFAGSAAVSIAAAFYGRVNHLHLNDVNRPLIELWSAILNDPDHLVDEYEVLWHEQQRCSPRAYYDFVRERFNVDPTPVDLLYLLSRAVKGAIRYNARGEFNQSPDNRRLGTVPTRLRRRLRDVAGLLAGRTHLSSTDYREVLESFPVDEIVYMDPPYEGVSGTRDSRYAAGLDRHDFIDELGLLINRGVAFILSYDGQTGDKTYGLPLPAELGLERLSLHAGRSTSSTLLGGNASTVESLYLSPSPGAAYERVQYYSTAVDTEPCSTS